MRAPATIRPDARATRTKWSPLFTSERQDWRTPPDLFKELDEEFHFTLDACALPHNATLPRYFTPDDDGLRQDWAQERVWCNPPYNNLAAWLAKGHDSARKGALCVFLIPARTDTKAWHNHAVHAHEIRFLKGRLKFGNATNSAPFPSAIAIFRPPLVLPVQLNLWEPFPW
jgi:phage N-6-adenine-methyltransferase